MHTLSPGALNAAAVLLPWRFDAGEAAEGLRCGTESAGCDREVKRRISGRGSEPQRRTSAEQSEGGATNWCTQQQTHQHLGCTNTSVCPTEKRLLPTSLCTKQGPQR
ncbi:unnamed protein product [Lampetra planeri]